MIAMIRRHRGSARSTDSHGELNFNVVHLVDTGEFLYSTHGVFGPSKDDTATDNDNANVCWLAGLLLRWAMPCSRYSLWHRVSFDGRST